MPNSGGFRDPHVIKSRRRQTDRFTRMLQHQLHLRETDERSDTPRRMPRGKLASERDGPPSRREGRR